MYLLDTDTCSYVMKRTHPAAIDRMRRFRLGELKVSTIARYELEYGARRSTRCEELLIVIGSFLSRVDVLPFDAGAARMAAQVRAALATAGTPIGFYDTLIAGHARSLGAVLVTHNVAEFGRVDELQIEDWAV
ncbi:MAG TPA: type II toxin-antitoxin system VapC family toxin [Acidobacteriota bacterium]